MFFCAHVENCSFDYIAYVFRLLFAATDDARSLSATPISPPFSSDVVLSLDIAYVFANIRHYYRRYMLIVDICHAAVANMCLPRYAAVAGMR